MISVVNLKQAICIPRRLTIKPIAIIHDPNLRGGTGTKQGRKVFLNAFFGSLSFCLLAKPVLWQPPEQLL
ncbi:MAG TPA: hypothetical protein VE956_09940 [Nodularia sp. (in: cyanobacteria)]|nr:hypothetical protein [Nodularia sp. (in: cyanobacteria)]